MLYQLHDAMKEEERKKIDDVKPNKFICDRVYLYNWIKICEYHGACHFSKLSAFFIRSLRRKRLIVYCQYT